MAAGYSYGFFMPIYGINEMNATYAKDALGRHGGPTVWGASGETLSGRGLPTSSPSANPVGGLEAFCLPSARVLEGLFRSP